MSTFKFDCDVCGKLNTVILSQGLNEEKTYHRDGDISFEAAAALNLRVHQCTKCKSRFVFNIHIRARQKLI